MLNPIWIISLTLAFVATGSRETFAQEPGKADPPAKKADDDPDANPKMSKSKKGKAKTDDDALKEDEGGFGAARTTKKTAKGKVVSDDKDRDKLRKAVSAKLAKKEKAIFVIKTVEQRVGAQSDVVDRGDRRPAKAKGAGFSASGQKIDFHCISGREAALDLLVEFLYQPKEPKASPRKSRNSKKGGDLGDDNAVHEPKSHKTWALMKQFDDSKEREATEYCARLKDQQEMLEKRQQDQQRAQVGEQRGGFGKGRPN